MWPFSPPSGAGATSKPIPHVHPDLVKARSATGRALFHASISDDVWAKIVLPLYEERTVADDLIEELYARLKHPARGEAEHHWTAP